MYITIYNFPNEIFFFLFQINFLKSLTIQRGYNF